MIITLIGGPAHGQQVIVATIPDFSYSPYTIAYLKFNGNDKAIPIGVHSSLTDEEVFEKYLSLMKN